MNYEIHIYMAFTLHCLFYYSHVIAAYASQFIWGDSIPVALMGASDEVESIKW